MCSFEGKKKKHFNTKTDVTAKNQQPQKWLSELVEPDQAIVV